MNGSRLCLPVAAALAHVRSLLIIQAYTNSNTRSMAVIRSPVAEAVPMLARVTSS